jgi:hypothetical protein
MSRRASLWRVSLTLGGLALAIGTLAVATRVAPDLIGDDAPPASYPGLVALVEGPSNRRICSGVIVSFERQSILVTALHCADRRPKPRVLYSASKYWTSAACPLTIGPWKMRHYPEGALTGWAAAKVCSAVPGARELELERVPGTELPVSTSRFAVGWGIDEGALASVLRFSSWLLSPVNRPLRALGYSAHDERLTRSSPLQWAEPHPPADYLLGKTTLASESPLQDRDCGSALFSHEGRVIGVMEDVYTGDGRKGGVFLLSGGIAEWLKSASLGSCG